MTILSPQPRRVRHTGAVANGEYRNGRTYGGKVGRRLIKEVIYRTRLLTYLTVIISFFLYIMIPDVRNGLRDLNPSYAASLQYAAENINDKCTAIFSMVHTFAQSPKNVSTLHDVLPSYSQIREIVLTGTSDLPHHTLNAFLDVCLASFIVSLKTAHLVFTLARVLLVALTIAAPFMQIVGQEFLALSTRAKHLLIATFAINLGLFYFWYTGAISRGVSRLSRVHRTLAKFCVRAGPYVAILLLVFLPLKLTLSVFTVKSSLQIGYVTALICFSLAAIRGIAPEERVASSPSFSSRVSAWFTSSPRLVPETPRWNDEKIVSLLVALAAWTSTLTLHALTAVPMLLLGQFAGTRHFPLSFNFFSTLGVSSATNAPLVISRKDVLQNVTERFAKSRLLSVSGFTRCTTTLEEVVQVCLLVMLFTSDSETARSLCRVSCRIVDLIISRSTGFQISVAPTNPEDSMPTSPATGSVPALLDVMPSPVRLLPGRFKSIAWLTIPMLFMFGPSPVVRVACVLAGVALPLLYALRALNAGLRDLHKAVHWTTYFSALAATILVSDVIQRRTIVAPMRNCRIRLLLICALHFLCSEPELAKQATRASVSALNSARRKFAPKSPTNTEPTSIRDSVQRPISGQRNSIKSREGSRRQHHESDFWAGMTREDPTMDQLAQQRTVIPKNRHSQISATSTSGKTHVIRTRPVRRDVDQALTTGEASGLYRDRVPSRRVSRTHDMGLSSAESAGVLSSEIENRMQTRGSRKGESLLERTDGMFLPGERTGVSRTRKNTRKLDTE